MNRIIIFIMLFVSQLSFGNDITIKKPATRPVMGEAFAVDFIIKTDSNQEPTIEFDTFGLDLISKSPGSYTSRTTYINGKYTSESTMRYTYEFIAPKSGFAYLRNIRVESNGKVNKHPSIQFNVLKEAQRTANIFARAELDKERAYVGESVIVRYYLYNKTINPINSSDIKKFPKLDKLLKRYHQEKVSTEQVRIKGELYSRRVIYTAQVFAENPGIYKIDPIAFRVGYSKRGSSFGNFGFGLRLGQSMTKTVRSKPVELDILPLPTENKPASFRGLVGNHTFKLQMNKNKFIVNEPIEIKLEVVGQGALELFEAPLILKDPSLEEFEKNSDFSMNADFTAKKSFNYTYLARDGLKLGKTNIKFSYFDIESAKYVEKEIPLESIIVAGSTGFKKSEKVDNKQVSKTTVSTSTEIEKFVFAPIYKSMSTFVYNAKYIAYISLLLSLFYIIWIVFGRITTRKEKEIPLLEEISKNGINYASLHKFICSKQTENTMEEVVKSLSLDSKTEQYFLKLIEKVTLNYKEDKDNTRLKINKKYFLKVYEKIN